MLNRLGTYLYTRLYGTCIGRDNFHNTYYSRKKGPNEERWVIYNGIYDPSKVPANWHAWLHFITEIPLDESPADWQPNATGTNFSHKGITSIENIPQSALNYYDRWEPNK